MQDRGPLGNGLAQATATVGEVIRLIADAGNSGGDSPVAPDGEQGSVSSSARGRNLSGGWWSACLQPSTWEEDSWHRWKSPLSIRENGKLFEILPGDR